MKLSMNKLTDRLNQKIRDYILPKYESGRGYNYQGCAEELNKLFEQENFITPDNVRTFFKGNYTQKKVLWIMLGLLQSQNVPYDWIFPAITKENLLEDEGYLQTYYGIMYPRNSTLSAVEKLRFFTLNINPGKTFEPPSAVLSYKNKGDENRRPISRRFTGSPVMSPKNDVVSILFQDETPRVGTFFHFYFPYHMVNGVNLKFSRGFVVTTLSDRQTAEIPVVLNFIMRNQPMDLSTLQIYPGLETLLQYANSSVYVPAEEFDAIVSKYPEVFYLFDSNDRLTKVTKEDLYVIDEPRVLRNIMENEPEGERRRKAYLCLLELKKASSSPTRVTWEALYDDLIKRIMGAQ